MRISSSLLPVALFAACAAESELPRDRSPRTSPEVPPDAARETVPVRVVGDGRDDGLLEVRRCRGVAARAACGLARDAESWRDLRAAFGGEVAELGPDYVVFAGEQVVVVPLGAGRAPGGVVVSSEEGVDVLTIDAVAGAPGQCEALVLHVEPFAAQVAIVRRDRVDGSERTLLVFSSR